MHRDRRLRVAGQSRPGIEFFDGARARIRYRLEGRGERTIVFTPDPPLTIEHYDELIVCLAPHFRVCVFDAPGFGFSFPKPGLRFDFETMTGEIEGFLASTVPGPSILALSCVAGFSAAAIAARRPDLVSHVVLIQTPGWQQALQWKARRDRYRILQTPFIGQALLYLLRRQRSQAWLDVAINDADLRARCGEVVDRCFDNGACFCLASVFQDYLVGDAPAIGRFEQPALIVWGSEDRSHRTTDRQSSLELAPQAQIVNVADAGHFPELEFAPAFATVLRDFADGRGS